jgi:ATPase subunit of ABC transporter with duplicated ATPase domains
MDDPSVLLKVSDLTAGYRTPVVGPVSLELRTGEVVGLSGPNGVGKSTLMNALTGTAHVFSGRIEKRPGLRLAHQHQNPLPLENVPLSGRELLALTGAAEGDLPVWLQPYLGKRLDRLSGGQLQLLQVWASLFAQADLVLLDEPTNNVDPRGTQHLEQQLTKRRDTAAVLIISHEEAFLARVCDRVIKLGP